MNQSVAPVLAPVSERASSLGWYSELSRDEKRTFLACFSGWALDALDTQMYALTIPTLIALWHMSTGEAGILGTSVLDHVGARRLAGGHAVRSHRPRARPADHHHLVLDVHVPVGTHQLVRAVALHAQPAGAGLRRRVGGRRGAHQRSHQPAPARPRRRRDSGRLGGRLRRRGDSARRCSSPTCRPSMRGACFSSPVSCPRWQCCGFAAT